MTTPRAIDNSGHIPTTETTDSLNPSDLIAWTERTLEGYGVITDDEPDRAKAYLHAAGLLMALGVTVKVDPHETSPGAELVRGLLLEARTGSGRSRRLV